MKKSDFRQAVPPVPQHFVQRMDDTLERIENMNKSTRRKMTTSLLVAAILTVLLAGTAVAATKIFGLMDFANRSVNGPKPLEGAADMIQTDLATVEGVTVTEGIYAGNMYAVVVDVPFNSMYPEWELLNAQGMLDGVQDHWKEGEGATFEISGVIEGEQPDTLKLEISLYHPENPKPVQANAEPDGPVGEESAGGVGNSEDYIIIPVELKHTQSRDAKLISQGEGEDWRIIDAKVSMTDYLAVLDVTFEYDACLAGEDGSDVAMLDVVVYDEQGNRLETGGSQFENEARDGKMITRCVSAMQSLKEMPEKLILQAKFIGEDEWMDKIECRVEAK